jgi:hypothetical protein
VWWHTPVFTAVRKLRQEDHKFQASLGYIVRPYLKKSKKQTTINRTLRTLLPSLVIGRRK